MSVLDHSPTAVVTLDASAVNLGACIVACLSTCDVMEGTGALEEFRTIEPVPLSPEDLT